MKEEKLNEGERIRGNAAAAHGSTDKPPIPIYRHRRIISLFYRTARKLLKQTPAITRSLRARRFRSRHRSRLCRRHLSSSRPPSPPSPSASFRSPSASWRPPLRFLNCFLWISRLNPIEFDSLLPSEPSEVGGGWVMDSQRARNGRLIE